MLCFSGTSLHAADYTFGYSFPFSLLLNKLPAGCSGSGGSYSCDGATCKVSLDFKKVFARFIRVRDNKILKFRPDPLFTKTKYVDFNEKQIATEDRETS